MGRFDVVSSITVRMLDKLNVKGVAGARQRLFLNWVDLDAIYPRAESLALRAELGIAADDFVALYSGNLGEKQGVNDLVEVARVLSGNPGVVILVCGDGAGRSRLSSRANGLKNICFLPLQPAARFNEFLGVADVHLLPQKPEVADLVMPSKLPGMLASGRPVIAAAAPDTQLANEIEGCGIVVLPGDVQGMADAILALRKAPGERARLGDEAARRARARWAKSPILLRFESDLEALVKSR
jgi:colanic acid biosynthesis glycosyl transferase WcaI